MADTAKRLYQGSPSSNTHTLAYTVPASTTAIIRSIHVSNSNTSTVNIIIGIPGTGATVANRFIDMNLATQSSYDWSGFMVLAATETIYVYSNLASCTFNISGVEVT